MNTYPTILFIYLRYIALLVSKCKITERIIRSFYDFKQPTTLKNVTGAIYQQISYFLKD